MLSEIKKELIKQPKIISDILSEFGFCNVNIHNTYITFGRDIEGSRKSIVIYLKDNENLIVKDHPRNIVTDLFSYIIKEKSVEYSEIFRLIKTKLNITDYYDYFEPKTIFGGFYDRIKKKSQNYIHTYENSILDNYVKCGNLRFLRDKISLETQRYFNICYDIESQGIVIPIYDQLGQIMGIKIRLNYDVDDGELKYYYLVPCLMSETLYGYSQNYKYLVENTVFIFESEKSIMQCYGYGVRNCVALGSSTISNKQIKMIMELHPKQVIFVHDEGLDFETIERNIKLLRTYTRMFEIEIGYWDSTKDNSIPHKASLSDLGKERLEYGLENEIIIVD